MLDRRLLKTPVIHLDVDRLIQRIALFALAGLLTIGLSVLGFHHWQMSDPYVRAVLEIEGDVSHGRAIFQMNCAGCHGDSGDGLVGPSLHSISAHKTRASLIRQVIGGQTPPMPQFQPSPETMADLLEYLETL